jgi:hypothetical protein
MVDNTYKKPIIQIKTIKINRYILKLTMLNKAINNSISTQINRKEREPGKGGEPEERRKNPSCKRI